MPWMSAASFGISALGHALNRTGGRKSVKATLADTSFIDDEVETIRSRNDQMTNKFMQTANAGVGFAGQTRSRTNQAMGVGQANSMLDQSRVAGFEQAADAGMRNENNSLQSITALHNMKAGLLQFNAQAQNNAAATNFQARRNDMNNFFGSLSAGAMAFGGQRRDDQRFNQIQSMNTNQFGEIKSMFDAYMKNLNQNRNIGVPG